MLGERLTDREWRGQSETIAVAAMAAVAIILVAAIGFFLLSGFFDSDDSEILLINVDGELTTEEIEFIHEGGDTVDPAELEVIFEGDLADSSLDPISDIRGLNEFDPDTERFGAGDRLSDSVSNFDGVEPDQPLLGDFTVFLIHEPTNTVIYEIEESILLDGEDDLTLSIDGDSETASVPGADESLIINEDEVQVPFTVTASFDGSDSQDITDAVVRATRGDDTDDGNVPADTELRIDGQSADGANPLSMLTDEESGLLAADDPGGDTLVTVNVEYLGTSSNSVTVDVLDPQFEYEISEADDGVRLSEDGSQVLVDYAVTNNALLTDEQDIQFEIDEVGVPEDRSETAETDLQLTPNETEEFEIAYDIQNQSGQTEAFEYAVSADRATDSLEGELGVEPSELDIDITDIALETDEAGDTVSIDYEVENLGDIVGVQDISFEGNVLEGETIVDTQTETDDDVTVGVDEPESGTFSLDVPIEDATEIDGFNATVATDDDNASAELAVEPADFEVDITDIDVAFGIDGETVEDEIAVSTTVTNTGELTATASLELTAGGEEQSSLSTAVEGSNELNTQLTAFEGDTEVPTDETEYVVSEDNTGAEDSETENFDGPELTIEIDDSELTEDGEVVIDWSVENEGNLSDVQDVEFSLDGTSADEMPDPVTVGLTPDDDAETGEFTVAVEPAESFEALGSTEDDDDTVEFDELTLPEFVVDSATASYDQGAEEFTVEYEVTNVGDFRAEQTINLAAGSDADSVVGDVVSEIETETELDAGESTDGASFTVTVDERADYQFAVETDDDSEETETETVSWDFVPDIQSVDVEDGEITVDYAVENEGNLTGENIDVEVVLENSDVQNTKDMTESLTLAPGDGDDREVSDDLVQEDVGADTVRVVTEFGEDDQDIDEIEGVNYQPTITNEPEPEDGELTVEYDLENIGDIAGEDVEVNVLIGETEKDSDEFSIGAGDTEEDESFTVTLDSDDVGEDTVTISTTEGEDSATFDEIEGATFEVTEVSTDTDEGDPAVAEAEEVTVTYELENVGDIAGDANPEFEVGGSTVGSDTISAAEPGATAISNVEPGERVEDTFTFTPESEDLATGTSGTHTYDGTTFDGNQFTVDATVEVDENEVSADVYVFDAKPELLTTFDQDPYPSGLDDDVSESDLSGMSSDLDPVESASFTWENTFEEGDVTNIEISGTDAGDLCLDLSIIGSICLDSVPGVDSDTTIPTDGVPFDSFDIDAEHTIDWDMTLDYEVADPSNNLDSVEATAENSGFGPNLGSESDSSNSADGTLSLDGGSTIDDFVTTLSDGNEFSEITVELQVADVQGATETTDVTTALGADTDTGGMADTIEDDLVSEAQGIVSWDTKLVGESCLSPIGPCAGPIYVGDVLSGIEIFDDEDDFVSTLESGAESIRNTVVGDIEVGEGSATY